MKINSNDQYRIKIHNEEHFKCVQDQLFRLGFKWLGGKPETYSRLNPSYLFFGEILSDKNVIFCAIEQRKLTQSELDYINVTLDHLFQAKVKKTSITVTLNEEYNAVVTKDWIKVGCQTFPIEIIDKLIAAGEELRENN